MTFWILLTLSMVFNLSNAQGGILYFPEEIVAAPQAGSIVPGNINLTEIRGTTLYESYVEQIISGGIAKLTLAINKVLLHSRSSTRDNIVFAPMSIGCALALIHLGSNGKTYDEITNILGLASGLDVQAKSVQVHEQFGRIILKLEASSAFEIGQQVSFAQGIFVQENYPIRKLYQETAQQLYESDIEHVDFENRPGEAQNTINRWVAGKTKGKIRDILAETPSSATKVIIASALYFKALWENPFFEGTTTRRAFYSNGRHQPGTAQVEMMANGGEFPYFKDASLQCEILGFPYKGNSTVMYVVMPFDSDTTKLKQLESTLTAGQLQGLADSTKMTGAVILFPRMKIESTIDLKGPLQTLGLKSLFDPTQANLALLSAGENNPHIPSTATTNQEYSGFSAQGSAGTIKNSPPQNYPLRSEAESVSPIPNTPDLSKTNKKDVLIFSRSKRIDNKGTYDARRIDIASRINTGNTESLDKLRQAINRQSTDNSYQNPGLYADKIIHKVYMDITETGTEAAASTSVSLSRDGNRVTFRVDVPFFFFIRHEQTKTVLFWGSVNTPTPNY